MKIKKKKSTQSLFDPTRKTVGAIYSDLKSKPGDQVLVGDLCTEILNSLCNDINKAIEMNPFNGDPFYIHIHEKRDMQMPDVFRRIVRHFSFRPYPEDDTTVFWHDPIHGETRFCWCLPHHAEMANIVASEKLFDPKLVEEVKAWRRNDLYFFGFQKDEEGNWQPNPNWKDKPMKIS